MITSVYTTLKEKALKEGRKEGREEFKKEFLTEKTEMVKDMLLNNEPLEKIIKYSKFSKTKIKQIEKELNVKN